MAGKPTLDEKLAALKARGKKAVAKPEPAAPVKQLMLEFWPDEVRGVPNAALRCAFFTAGKERIYLREWTPIASVEGIEVSAKGDRLNQHDLDLWEQLLHLQRLQPLESRVEFTAHSMLRALGRSTSGADHVKLNNDLGRLLTAGLQVRWTATRQSFSGNLISSYFRDEDTDRYVVRFNNDTMELYSQGYTWIDLNQRKALGRNLIAKALHGLYASHAKPYPYSVDMLWRLTAGGSKRIEFRRLLRVALDKLKQVGAIESWELGANDLVKVKHNPSASQRKHLARRGEKR